MKYIFYIKLICICFLAGTLSVHAKTDENLVKTVQQGITITGTVTEAGETLPGVNVTVKGTTIGVMTDTNGKYSIVVPNSDAVLQFSYVGFTTIEIQVGTRREINIALTEDTQQLEEVVVVGYGVQKKESIVGAIARATDEDIKRTGGGSDLRTALGGQLPGLVLLTSSGEPGGILSGETATSMFIRGQNTWNGGQPLILVDGIERDMSNVDANDVSSISVLKDASATAVFGVKGANGVILITTKRGTEGKTKMNASYRGTGLMLSKVPGSLDSYEAMMAKNETIEREVVLNESSWNDYVPYQMVSHFKKPQSTQDALIYPNINWEKEMFKKMGFSHQINLNAQGGNKSILYYGSLSYNKEGDIMKYQENGKGYEPDYSFHRFNFRTNVDVKLTRTTTFKINFDGYYGQKNTNYNNEGSTSRADEWMWRAVYGLAPNLFPVKYPDGRWGVYSEGGNATANPAAVIANLGIRQARMTQLNSNFVINQDLSFITKGLNVSAFITIDNFIRSEGGIWDTNHVRPNESGSNVPFKQIYWKRYDPDNPNQDPSEYTVYFPSNSSEFDWVVTPWSRRAELIRNNENWSGKLPVNRSLVYQFQLDYARTFGSHNVTGTGVFKREEYAEGNEFFHYLENWIFRTTYDYSSRYMLELNGAYNGSEQFGPGYRFAFFPSLAVGWYISNEKFLSDVTWLDRLKVRYSIGKVGDDKISNSRWLYDSQYAYGGLARLGSTTISESPYRYYRQTVVGNPDIQWESAVKNNIGLELGILKNLVSFSFDYFNEDRTKILMVGTSRSVPAYFGYSPPSANLGHVKSKGYEIELGVNKSFRDLRLMGKLAITHNENKIIFRDDPQLQFDYLKQAGYPIGQIRNGMNTGYFYTNWDEVYASVPTENNDLLKLPGFYDLLDFNADGIYKGSEDTPPIGYSEVPQNTANLTLGANYKGFSFHVQFYGVNNATRVVSLSNFYSYTDILFDHVSDYWSKDNPNATSFLPRWRTQGGNIGHYYVFDASYVRLRNIELGYSFSNNAWAKRAGVSNLRLYLNGNDLWFWSRVPDDRQTTYNGGSASGGAYPTLKRISLGIELSF